MLILLKTLCFALWMLIMLALIAGSRRTTTSAYQIYLEDQEERKIPTKRVWDKK